MNKTIRNVLALLAALVLGSAVNMGLIMVSGHVVPLPAGVDATDMESLKASMHLFEPRNFVFPFLAHALGTLAGAFVAAKLAASHKMTFALVVGGFFLLGGITNAFMLPSPVWFIALDVVVAYLPMAWIGGRLGGARK